MPRCNSLQSWSALFILLILSALPIFGAPFRVTIFEKSSNVDEAVAVFRKAGLTPKAEIGFRTAISNYFAEPISFDRSKFPRSLQGWFSFNSVTDFISALPFEPWRIEHNYELTCFDFVLLLNLQNFTTTLRQTNLSGPFLPPHTEADGSISFPPTATARDAYEQQYPDWIRERAEKLWDAKDQDKRVSLMALLLSGHPLPLNTSAETLGSVIQDALHSNWSRFSVSFPKEPQIILVHQVDLKKHFFVTVHTGCVFRNGDRLLYFEKSGGTGPFLSFDAAEEKDIQRWILYSFRSAKKNGYSHLAITFGDEKALVFDLAKFI